jgi:multidrug resistance efflux pump
MKKLKLIIYLVILLSIPIFVIGSLFSRSVDVAIIKVNKYTFNSYMNAAVESVNVYAGEKVQKNQLLLVLSSAELTSQLAVLNANITDLKILHLQELTSLTTMQRAANNALTLQETELSRYQKYVSSGAVSLMMMDTQMQNYNTARANLDAIRASIISSNLQYQQSLSVLLLKQSETMQKINSLRIVARESGVVSKVAVTRGQTVNASSELVTIDAGYSLVVRTNKVLPEKTHIKVGARFIKCTTTNVSNQERDFALLNSNNDKTIYLLSCPALPSKYIIDGFAFYVW